jgi:peptidoglycan biosynthesis protein MviN/MurJ (putative lipid II flippase)
VQGLAIGTIIGATFLCLMLVALRSRRSGRDPIGIQLALGVIVGIVAAATAVAVRADLVPDDVELTVVAAVVILTTAGLMVVMLRDRTR